METESWQQVRTLFRDALELDPEDRDAYLSQACANDGVMRSEVERLLTSLGEAGDFLEEPVRPSGVIPADPYNGLEIKPYRLVKRIGRGGMGLVYLATRAPPTGS